ncbi:MAG: LLM class flavin-dependent oxidoreductase [Nitriliruptorales bacterium]|nr:LLM class flavin-dependent oxidoreductase [Nitriliruptorales bacterium]
MKFIAFNLMPYRELPADFEKSYSSVWVDIPRRLYDPVQGAQMYMDYLEELELAVDLGYDAVGVNEHHQNAYGMMPSPNLWAASLARKVRESESTSLMVLGNSLALYNPPVRVAEEFAMLDALSGGRLIAGFPTGSSQDVNYSYGINPAELRDRYHEAHDLIIKAWAAKDIFAFNGTYTQLRYVNLWPRLIQEPRPPVWVPGGGSLETYDFALTNGYNFSYLSFYGYKYAKSLMDMFWKRADELGVERNPFQGAFAQFVLVSESDEQAREEYEEHVMYFYRKCMHIDPHYVEAPGYRSARSTKNVLKARLEGTSRSGRDVLKGGFGWDELRAAGYIIAGSPETVRNELEAAARSLNVANVALLLQVGSAPHELTCKNTTLFAKEVMPALRGVFSEFDPTDYWPAAAQPATQ